MEAAPLYTRNFVAVQVFEAIYRVQDHVEPLLIEIRTDGAGKRTVFTVLDKSPVYADSLQELVIDKLPTGSLTIHHDLHIWKEGRIQRVELLESLTPLTHAPHQMGIQLSLVSHHETYNTTPCNTLTEAVRELGEVMGESGLWYLQTCHDCNYSGPAFLGPGWDDRDDLRCYRDTPNAHAQVKKQGKFAPLEVLYAGSYFVHAFHTCAAWAPLEPSVLGTPGSHIP